MSHSSAKIDHLTLRSLIRPAIPRSECAAHRRVLHSCGHAWGSGAIRSRGGVLSRRHVVSRSCARPARQPVPGAAFAAIPTLAARGRGTCDDRCRVDVGVIDPATGVQATRRRGRDGRAVGRAGAHGAVLPGLLAGLPRQQRLVFKVVYLDGLSLHLRASEDAADRPGARQPLESRHPPDGLISGSSAGTTSSRVAARPARGSRLSSTW